MIEQVKTYYERRYPDAEVSVRKVVNEFTFQPGLEVTIETPTNTKQFVLPVEFQRD